MLLISYLRYGKYVSYLHTSNSDASDYGVPTKIRRLGGVLLSFFLLFKYSEQAKKEQSVEKKTVLLNKGP